MSSCCLMWCQSQILTQPPHCGSWCSTPAFLLLHHLELSALVIYHLQLWRISAGYPKQMHIGLCLKHSCVSGLSHLQCVDMDFIGTVAFWCHFTSIIFGRFLVYTHCILTNNRKIITLCSPCVPPFSTFFYSLLLLLFLLSSNLDHQIIWCSSYMCKSNILTEQEHGQLSEVSHSSVGTVDADELML